MRTFSSYGPINKNINYYAPRENLINKACSYLIGEIPGEEAHYITVWAPRQTGKTWIMQEVYDRIQNDPRFYTVFINLQIESNDLIQIINYIIKNISEQLKKELPAVENLEQFQYCFKKERIEKPLVLILDEFDSLPEQVINSIVNSFRNIFNLRKSETQKNSFQKKYMLHSIALIGVRSVLGIENVKGSPFNVQRSIQIPNLTYDEVRDIFNWYARESKQKIEQEVIDQLYYECNGQPGLTCWFGELLTETYNNDKKKPITIKNFNDVYSEASQVLPNNNIINIISKVKREPYKTEILELFKTAAKIPFRFDNPEHNYMYMNGIIDLERLSDKQGNAVFIRFASPFIQKRIFNYFSNDLFKYMGQVVEPFENLSDAITENSLNIKNIARKYQKYLQNNKAWLFKDAPRRKDLRLYEAIYHFNFYRYLFELLREWNSTIYPEFPAGNGKVDLMIRHNNKSYAIELKSFTTEKGYHDALKQASHYCSKLNLSEITLVFFIETIDERNKQKYEKLFFDKDNQVTVVPVFIEI